MNCWFDNSLGCLLCYLLCGENGFCVVWVFYLRFWGDTYVTLLLIVVISLFVWLLCVFVCLISCVVLGIRLFGWFARCFLFVFVIRISCLPWLVWFDCWLRVCLFCCLENWHSCDLLCIAVWLFCVCLIDVGSLLVTLWLCIWWCCFLIYFFACGLLFVGACCFGLGLLWLVMIAFVLFRWLILLLLVVWFAVFFCLLDYCVWDV